MKTNDSVLKVSTLAAALMAAYGAPALADNYEVAEYIAPESTISAGIGYQSKDRPQFGIFDGRQDNGAKLLLDADVKKRDDATGTWSELRANNIGLDNPDLSLSHSRQGDYGASFEYSRINRESAYTINTGLVGVGGLNQTVTQVNPGTGSDLHLGTKRNRYTFGITKVISDSFEVSAKYRQEEKDGLRHFGAYIANVPKFLVEPINSTTRQLDLMLNFLSKDLQLQAGYYGSTYDNRNGFINATGPTYIATPPDNLAHQVYVNGAYAFTPTTKGTLRLSRGIATQDDQSMVTGLPAGQVWAGFNGVKAKRLNTEYQVGISSQPVKDLSLVANIHYLGRKDKTPLVTYNTLGDQTTPKSFTSLNGKLEASYRLAADLRLLGGAYVEKKERSVAVDYVNIAATAPTNAGASWTVPAGNAANVREVPYRAENKEITYKGQATKNFSDMMSGSLVLSHSKRDGSSYYWGNQQNLVNPLHMANRDRDKVGIKLDLSPLEALSVQVQWDQAKDDYGTNGLNGDTTAANGKVLYGTGIKDGSAQLWSLDANYQVNDDWSVAAWYSYDDSKATQYAFQDAFGTDPIRKSHLRDTGDSFGLNVKGKATAKLSVGAGLQLNRSVGKYNQDNVKDAGATLNENLPDITNKALRLSLNGIYQLDKSSALRIDVIHDRWVTNDWTWQMWNNAQTALVPLVYNADGTMVTANSRQTSNFLSVRYMYKFQ